MPIDPLYPLRLTAEEVKTIWGHLDDSIVEHPIFGKLEALMQQVEADEARPPRKSKTWWDLCPDCHRPIEMGQVTLEERYDHGGFSSVVLTATGRMVRRVHNACFALRGT